MKCLIVNADDLGYSQGINEGIIQAHKNGIVTSTSLMVYGKAAEQAINLAKKLPKLGVGLHFQIGKEDLGVLTQQLNKALAVATIEKTKKEFIEQVELFTKLTGKLPDHIDGHYHIHKLPLIFPFISKFASKNNIPLRDNGVNFIRTFYGMNDEKKISTAELITIFQELPEGNSELMCHPAKYTDDLESSSYKKQRETELNSLTSDGTKKAIEVLNIKLINWSDIQQKIF